MMKLAKFGSAFLCLLALSGCTMAIWQNNEVVETKHVENVVITDNIVSFFKYQNLKITANSEDTSKMLELPQQGMGFLGDSNIYFLTEGESELLALNENINQIPFVSVKSKDSIRLQFTPSDNPNVKGYFIETYKVKVDKPKQDLSAQELKTLEELGFRHNGYGYFKSIDVEGVIIDRARLDMQLNPQEKLNRSYKIELYTKGYKSTLNATNLVSNLAYTPLTVVGDIIFVPIAYGLLLALYD